MKLLSNRIFQLILASIAISCVILDSIYFFEYMSKYNILVVFWLFLSVLTHIRIKNKKILTTETVSAIMEIIWMILIIIHIVYYLKLWLF
jgi:hypothetical protein